MHFLKLKNLHSFCSKNTKKNSVINFLLFNYKMNEAKSNNKLYSCALSAVISGTVTKSICAPFERIRLLYQVQGMFNSQYSAEQVKVYQLKYSGLADTAHTIFREEGLLGFWRGNGTNIIRASVVYAMKFSTNDFVKDWLLKSKQKKEACVKNNDTIITGLPSDKKNISVQLGTTGLLKAGGIAGVVQKVVSYPLDLLTVRIALGINTSKLTGSHTAYLNLWDCIRRIKLLEGYSGFYKGFAPTILTGVPYVMLQMTFFEIYKRQLEQQNDGTQKKNKQKSPGWVKLLLTSGLSGSLAGVTAQSIVFPGDTIRKRMMSNGIDGHKRFYTGSWDCAIQIYKREGILAFYSGILPLCLRAIPSGAIQFGTYELCKALFFSSTSP